MSDRAIVWEDPPKKRRGGRHRLIDEETLALLRKNPGRWGRLLVYVRPNSAYQTQQRLTSFYRADGFEFTTRTAAGITAVYGRCIGDEGRQDG